MEHLLCTWHGHKMVITLQDIPSVPGRKKEKGEMWPQETSSYIPLVRTVLHSRTNSKTGQDL